MRFKRALAFLSAVLITVAIPAYLVKAQVIGDFNGDNKVDMQDLLELSRFMNTTNAKYDLNGDGIVDIYDMSFLERNMGDYTPVQQHEGALGVTRDFILYLRPEPRGSSQSNILIPVGSRVDIHARVGNFYMVTYIAANGSRLDGYITRHVDIIRDDAHNSFLGVISEKYESNGQPGVISTGAGDFGGKSYGAWQLSSRMGAVDAFLIWLKDINREFFNTLDAARRADNLGPNSFGANFDAAWKSIADSHYDEFLKIQQHYIKVKYYDDLVRRLDREGIYRSQQNTFATRNVLWSLAVQHGSSGAQRLIKNASPTDTHNEFIEGVYEERSRVEVYFVSSPTLHNSLRNRFNNERNDALRVLNFENALR
jgi:hypothetical protein